MQIFRAEVVLNHRRSPHGERGLKCKHRSRYVRKDRRSPHGERGLKWLVCFHGGRGRNRRSPHGERGLKFRRHGAGLGGAAVAPHTGSVD